MNIVQKQMMLPIVNIERMVSYIDIPPVEHIYCRIIGSKWFLIDYMVIPKDEIPDEREIDFYYGD